MNFIESPVTRCFVAPLYCQQLEAAGFHTKTIYTWKIYHDLVKLHTTAFDADGMNAQAYANQDFIAPPILVIPAYSIMEVEREIPKDYCLSFTKDYEYVLMPSTLWPVEGVTDIRMPDVFARHLLDCIRHRVIAFDKINKGEKHI